MDIKPYTPLVRMQHKTIYRKALDWYDELAAEYGVDKNVLFAALIDYTALPFRLNGGAPKGLDFAFPDISDTPESLKKKFIAYLNTACTNELAAMEAAIIAYDSPADAALAPESDPADPEA